MGGRSLSSAIERFDFRAPGIRLGATPIEETLEGYRIYEGTATFGDVVLHYPEHGGYEFRPAEEVLSPEAVKSMVGVPLTNKHPPHLLTADDAATYSKGAVLSAERVDDGPTPRLRVRVVVHDRELQDAIEAGRVELSPGYRGKNDKRPGVHRGQRFDGSQRAVRYNHLACVDAARTVTPDGEVARLDEENTMETVEITLPDGTKYMVPKAIAEYLLTLQQQPATAPEASMDGPKPPAAPMAGAPATAPPVAMRMDAAAIEKVVDARLVEFSKKLPGLVRRELVDYADIRAVAEPILKDAEVEHRFDGDPFADKTAVCKAVWGKEDADVVAAEKANDVARMDGLFKGALREHGRRRDGGAEDKAREQLEGLARQDGKGDDKPDDKAALKAVAGGYIR